MKANYAVRQIVCKGCSAQITKRMPSGRLYCSLNCYRKGKRPQRMTGEMRLCGWCKVSIYVSRCFRKEVNFCSVGCCNNYQGRNKSNHTCKVCSKPFRWSPSRVKTNNPTYCSIACRSACPDWRRTAIAANAKLQMISPTSLELAGRALLTNLGLAFVEQALIADKFLVDVFLPEFSIVIQWDGDYWHGYRALGDTTALEARVLKRVNFDKSQDAYMKKSGYLVLRFWEHEVLKQPESVCETITRTIRQIAA